jgi:hypothetical protein
MGVKAAQACQIATTMNTCAHTMPVLRQEAADAMDALLASSLRRAEPNTNRPRAAA